jgi:hypothetical protein
LFYLWGINIDPAQMETEPHPPTAMRFASAFNLASTIIRHERMGQEKRFLKICNDALSRSHAAVVAIGGTSIEAANISPVFEERARSHYKKIRKCWYTEIMPKLKQHGYVEIPDVDLREIDV